MLQWQSLQAQFRGKWEVCSMNQMLSDDEKAMYLMLCGWTTQMTQCCSQPPYAIFMPPIGSTFKKSHCLETAFAAQKRQDKRGKINGQ
jgi:hypothetical protein